MLESITGLDARPVTVTVTVSGESESGSCDNEVLDSEASGSADRENINKR